jgi:hypothetical protein
VSEASITADAMTAREFLKRFGNALELPGVPMRAPRALVDAFEDGVAAMPAPLAVEAVIRFIQAAPANDTIPHPKTGDPSLTYERPGGTAVVSYRAGGLAAPAEVWAKVRALKDELTTDVLLAALVQWSAQRDSDGLAYLSASHVLGYRGIQPKTKREGSKRYRAGHRAEDIAEVATAFEHLDRVFVEIDQVVIEDESRGRGRRRTKPKRFALESKLISVTDRVSQLQLDGDRQPVGWFYRPGKGVTNFVDGPNRQTATLMQVSLQYDPLRRLWEKRLSRYFAFHPWEGDLTLGVGDLLREVRLTHDVDTRNPGRTRKRFEEALDRLTADRVLGGWEPGYASASLPARGWIDKWLSSSIIVRPPVDRVPALAMRPLLLA